MRIEADTPRSFDRSSPVLSYWLPRCTGFRVRCGGREGVVEDVELEPTGDRAAYLVVRFGRRRRGIVAADAASEVVPADELIVLPFVDLPPSRLAAAARRLATAGAPAARSWRHAVRHAWHGTHRWADRSAAATRDMFSRLAHWLAPRVAAAGRLAARATLAAAAGLAAAAAATARAVRTHGPPAARLAARALAAATVWLLVLIATVVHAVGRAASAAAADLRDRRVTETSAAPAEPEEPDRSADEPHPEPGRARGHAA